MSLDTPVTRRSGGRAARRAARAAALPSDLRPVRPGMSGGHYAPLTDADINRIHQAALQCLEEIGLADAPPSGIEIMTNAGAVLGADGRLRYPRALVEDTLAMACKSITLPGRDPAYDLDLTGSRVHYGTAGAAVHVVDIATNAYRDSTVTDLHKAAHLVQHLDNIHFLQRPMVCRDIVDNKEMDLNTIYACCAGTLKHIGTSFVEPDFIPDCLEMIYMIAGGEAAFRDRPFISNSNCFVVPPMKFATESCEVMERCIRGGLPVLLLSAGMAGATAPPTLAGALVQAVAECLAGLVYVNAVKPGHPAIMGTWPFGLDLRTGAMSVGSGEQALMSAASAQMHRFYGIPGGAAAGASDSKLPDMQAGWEQMCSNVLAGTAGLNMVYEAAGMHASLLGFCFESLVLGDDLIGQAQRCVRGIEVTEDTVAVETIRETVLGSDGAGGPGHYLGSGQTLSLMQKDYVYPTLGDRTSPKEWAEKDKPDLVQNAIRRTADLFATPTPAKFDPILDQALRARFNIHLPV